MKKDTILQIKKLNEDATLPTRKYPTDAGMDIYSIDNYEITPHSSTIVKTGVTVDFPDNTVGFVWPKSRVNFLIGAGVIDNTYQGEILVKVFNTSSEILKIQKGQAIAQIVITPVICPIIKEVQDIHQNQTERGQTGGIVNNLKGCL